MDPDAGIRHRHRYVPAGFHAAFGCVLRLDHSTRAGDCDGAAVWHRVTRIEHEIHHDVVEFGRVNHYRGPVRIDLEIDRDVARHEASQCWFELTDRVARHGR